MEGENFGDIEVADNITSLSGANDGNSANMMGDEYGGNRTSRLFLPLFATLFHFNSSGTLQMLQFPEDDGGGKGENGSFSRTPLVFGSATTTDRAVFYDEGESNLPDQHSSPAAIFAVLVTFSICTILGNSLVIIAVLREHYLKSPPNYFVASLAAADISVGILLVPFEATFQLLNRRWIFGDLWCELWHSFDVLLSTASILNLCVISLDRYWAICTPMSYPRRMTTKRACKFIALVWILAILISLPAIFWWRSVRTGEISPETCPFTEDVGYLISSSCISFYIPLSVMLFAYYKIYKAAVKQSRSIQQGAKLFSSHDKNGTGDMTLRMHRGGCASDTGSDKHSVLSHTQQRKSFSFGRSDPSGLSLLSNVKRAASVRVHNNKCKGKRAFSESVFPCPFEVSANVGENGESKHEEQERQIGISDQNDGGSRSDIRTGDIAAGTISSVDAAGFLLPLPINNNYNHQNHHQHQTIPHASTPILPILSSATFRRHSRRSFTVARKLAKFAKEKKAAKTLAIVLGVFIICWLPFFVINIVFALCKSCAEKHLILFEVVTWLGWINSAMNPLIYACLSQDFRRAFARLLGCARCLRARQRRKTQRRLSVV